MAAPQTKVALALSLVLAFMRLRSTEQSSKTDFVGNIFSAYNEDAEIFQTGVLIRLMDDTFYFNDSTLGLRCADGYMRPVVLNRVKTELIQNSQPPQFKTRIVMRNVTMFYKDCRVSKRSPDFQDAEESTPCYLNVDIEFLLGWITLGSKNDTNNTCNYYLELKMDENPIGVGMVDLYILPTSTLHTFPLTFEEVWTDKVNEAVKRMSLIYLSEVDCKVLPNTDKSERLREHIVPESE